MSEFKVNDVLVDPVYGPPVQLREGEVSVEIKACDFCGLPHGPGVECVRRLGSDSWTGPYIRPKVEPLDPAKNCMACGGSWAESGYVLGREGEDVGPWQSRLFSGPAVQVCSRCGLLRIRP